MQPSEGFWEGLGGSIGSSPGWMVVGALLVVGVLFVVARYIYPGHKEIKMRELDIRQREADNDAERIKSSSAMVEQLSGLRESNQSLAMQTAAMTARLNESAERSHEMGGKVDDTNRTAHRIDETTRDTNALVAEVHSIIVRKN